MRIEDFNSKKHGAVHRWLERHNHPPVNHLPEVYWVVPGVAALGILPIGKRAILIDSLVSNPLASSAARNKAISALVNRAMAWADLHNVGCLALTSSSSTLARAEDVGFKQLPETVLWRNPRR